LNVQHLFIGDFLFFFSVSRHRREWRATVTSSCARLLVLCPAFYFSRLWARPPPLYCVGTIPPLGFKVYPFSLLLLERYIYILLARNAIGFTVDWIRLVASGR
jgi:hypothetical protein